MADRPKLTRQGPGTAYGPQLPAASQYVAPSAIDSGQADGNRITFTNWRGEADKPEPDPPILTAPDQRLGIAIVGLGRLTLNEILPAFSQCAHARVVALVSDSPEKARITARQYGVAEQSIYRYADIHTLADNPAVHAVYIVTPNGRHRDHVLAAAKAGKHVLCEKPMANTSAQAREMVTACAAAGVKLMIAYRCHFEPFNQQVVKLSQSGDLGRPRIIEATSIQAQGPDGQWRMKAALAGGGALPDIGLYCVNGVRTVMGEEPCEVYAQIINSQGDPRYAEVEETISFMLRFPSGAIANCASSYGAHEAKDLRIRLERGWIDLENAFAYTGQHLRIARREGKNESVQELRIGAKNQFSEQIDHFADCVLHNKAVKTPGEEGVRDHVVMEAIYRSAREGRPVTLDY